MFSGKSFLCQCTVQGRLVTGNWTLADGNQYAEMNENGKVSIKQGVVGQAITICCRYGTATAQKTITVSYDNQLTIECATAIVGESGTAIAIYNSEVV